jgi:iron-sulfur cluster assembly protein
MRPLAVWLSYLRVVRYTKIFYEEGMAITLTDSAAERVRSYLESRGSGFGLRLGVKKTGCSGFAYVINYADKVEPDDIVFEDAGVSVVVDP